MARADKLGKVYSMLTFYLQLLLILGGATALASWCGWGIARLALPDALQPYRALLTPLLGYALVIVVGYWFVWTISGLTPALLVLLLATGALNRSEEHTSELQSLRHL